MTELLFIGITIFFIYVVFQVVGKDEEPAPSQAESKPAETPEPVKPATEEAVAAPPSSPKAGKPASKRSTKAAKPAPAKAQTAVAETTSESAANVAGDSIKNPKTGEVAKISGNYAFAKRWIKDALVEEGLLDKVYKNNELDADTTAKIQDALQKLKALPKYQ